MLGIGASIGFLFLVLWFVLRRRSILKNYISKLNLLSVMNVYALLLSSIGGFSFFVAVTLTKKIRSYNRISVFIVFFSLFALGAIADNLLKKMDIVSRRIIVVLVFFGIFIVFLIDQTGAYRTGTLYENEKNQFLNDRIFVEKIEGMLKPGSMIFQLPYTNYPEGNASGTMDSYDHLKPYLHSHHLRWSFGAMEGRWADKWQKSITSAPFNVSSFSNEIRSKGFSAVWVDRAGYDGNVTILERSLVQSLKGKTVESDNKRYCVILF